jgi:hypothetical protein
LVIAIVVSELAATLSVGFSSSPENQLYRSRAGLAASEMEFVVPVGWAGVVELEPVVEVAGGGLEEDCVELDGEEVLEVELEEVELEDAELLFDDDDDDDDDDWLPAADVEVELEDEDVVDVELPEDVVAVVDDDVELLLFAAGTSLFEVVEVEFVVLFLEVELEVDVEVEAEGAGPGLSGALYD